MASKMSNIRLIQPFHHEWKWVVCVCGGGGGWGVGVGVYVLIKGLNMILVAIEISRVNVFNMWLKTNLSLI